MKNRLAMLNELNTLCAADKAMMCTVRQMTDALYNQLTELEWDQIDVSAALQDQTIPAPGAFAEAVLEELQHRVGTVLRLTNGEMMWLIIDGRSGMGADDSANRRHCDFCGDDGMPIPAPMGSAEMMHAIGDTFLYPDKPGVPGSKQLQRLAAAVMQARRCDVFPEN